MKRGLDALHNAGWCHADVKPQNIFMDHMSKCVLGDFDAASRLGLPLDRTTPMFLSLEWQNRRQSASKSLDYNGLLCTIVYLCDPSVDYASEFTVSQLLNKLCVQGNLHGGALQSLARAVTAMCDNSSAIPVDPSVSSSTTMDDVNSVDSQGKTVERDSALEIEYCTE